MNDVQKNENDRLNVERFKGRSETLKTDDNGTVLLNRENADHVEWFEADDT